jgi:ketosteroid isomerase-like protein
MKSAKLLFLMIALLLVSSGLVAQTDEVQIMALREASNLALKAYDNEKVLSFLTDDALTTTGNGTLLAGKEALKTYIAGGAASKMYWVRSPKEITVNAQNGLAWETGTWKGYDPEKGPYPVVGGNYSAMWTKDSGTWKIKSQLFVAL